MAYLYPYGDTQQLNLDWLIEQWNEVKSQIDGSLQAEIDRVEAAITDLLTARDEAVAAQTAAQASAQAAAGSASTASGAASTATAQAQAAAGSAATAGAHASDAQGYAATAQQAAQAANNSASAAAVSEGNARNSETAAAGSSSAAAGNALYAEGYAKGTQNGNPVSSGSPYYENNAKYYSDQAAQDASDAADAAQDAQDAAALIDLDATAADIGKALIVKTVADGKVSEFEFGESGGGGSQIIPTEECLWKELFNKDYTFSGVNSRSGYVKGNHIYCTASSSSSTPIGLPIHGALTGAIQRYIYPTINLTEADFIDIPPRMNDFSIECMFANDWEQNPDSGRGIKVSLFTYQNGEVVPVYDSGKFLYNYGKSIIQPNILTRFPIFRETRKIYILMACASQSAGQIFDFRFILKSCVNPTVSEIISRYSEFNFIATRAYSTNAIVQIGSALYRITAPIANGAEIIENTNASRIYISDVLTNFYNS